MERQLFALEVFLYSIEECRRPEGQHVTENKQRRLSLHTAAPPKFSGNGVAVQFLDYPVFYLPVKTTTGVGEGGKLIETYGCGKRCILEADLRETQMLMNQVPLFLMHITAKSNGNIHILSTGSVPTVIHVPKKTEIGHLDNEGFTTYQVAMTDASQKQTSTASLCVRVSLIAPLQGTQKSYSGGKQSWKEVAMKSQTRPRVKNSGKDSLPTEQPFMERFVGRLEELRSKSSELKQSQGVERNRGDGHHCPGCCFTVPTKATVTQQHRHSTGGTGKSSCPKKQGSRNPSMAGIASRQRQPVAPRKGKPSKGHLRTMLCPPNCHSTHRRDVQRPVSGNTKPLPIKCRNGRRPKVKRSGPYLSCVPEDQEQNSGTKFSAYPHCQKHYHPDDSYQSQPTVQQGVESNSESNSSDGSQPVDMDKKSRPCTHQPNLTKKRCTSDSPKAPDFGVQGGFSMCTATLWELVNLISMRTVLSQAVTTMGNQMTSFANQTMQQLATGLLPVAGEQPSVIATLGAVISQQVLKEISKTNKVTTGEAPQSEHSSEPLNKGALQQTTNTNQTLVECDKFLQFQPDAGSSPSPEQVENELRPAKDPVQQAITSLPTPPLVTLKKSVSFPEEATVVDLKRPCSPRVWTMQANLGPCDRLGSEGLSPKSRRSAKNVDEWRIPFDGERSEVLHGLAKEPLMATDVAATLGQVSDKNQPHLQADRQKSLATSISSVHSEIYEEDFEASPETPRSKQSRTSTLSTRGKDKIVTSRTPSGILLGEILSGSSCSSDGSGQGLEAQPSTLRSVSTRMSEIYEDDFEQADSELDSDPNDKPGLKQEKPDRIDDTPSSTHSSDFLSIHDSLDINDLLGDTDFLRNQSSH